MSKSRKSWNDLYQLSARTWQVSRRQRAGSSAFHAAKQMICEQGDSAFADVENLAMIIEKENEERAKAAQNDLKSCMRSFMPPALAIRKSVAGGARRKQSSRQGLVSKLRRTEKNRIELKTGYAHGTCWISGKFTTRMYFRRLRASCVIRLLKI